MAITANPCAQITRITCCFIPAVTSSSMAAARWFAMPAEALHWSVAAPGAHAPVLTQPDQLGADKTVLGGVLPFYPTAKGLKPRWGSGHK
jgi:hypothetical protein